MIQLPEKSPILIYSHSMRSRYGETDKMGYVYYGNYLDYFETARTEMIRSMGIPYTRLENDGIILPVIYSQISYKQPIHYDELMDIQVIIYEEPMVKLNTYYKVFTEKRDKAHITGQVILCFTNKQTRKPCRAPSYLLEKLDEMIIKK